MAKTYTVKIEDIQILDKALYSRNVSPTDVLLYEVQAQPAIPDITDLLVVYVSVKILNQSKGKELVGKVLAGFPFAIENLGKIFPKAKSGEYLIPKDLEDSLKMICISTMRGIMYSEFRGTVLSKAILPIITLDSMHFIKENIFEQTA